MRGQGLRARCEGVIPPTWQRKKAALFLLLGFGLSGRYRRMGIGFGLLSSSPSSFPYPLPLPFSLLPMQMTFGEGQSSGLGDQDGLRRLMMSLARPGNGLVPTSFQSMVVIQSP